MVPYSPGLKSVIVFFWGLEEPLGPSLRSMSLVLLVYTLRRKSFRLHCRMSYISSIGFSRWESSTEKIVVMDALLPPNAARSLQSFLLLPVRVSPQFAYPGGNSDLLTQLLCTPSGFILTERKARSSYGIWFLCMASERHSANCNADALSRLYAAVFRKGLIKNGTRRGSF